MQLVKICINMVPTLNLTLVIMIHYFVRSLIHILGKAWEAQLIMLATGKKKLGLNP